MARNEEKAMSTLNRWIDQKVAMQSGGLSLESVPKNPQDCRDAKKAEYFRGRVVRDLVSLIERIQDSSLDDDKCRTMNAEVNRLFALKESWNRHVLFLGGRELVSSSAGKDSGLEGNKGIRYYGHAKTLPEARNALPGRTVSSSTSSTDSSDFQMVMEGRAMKQVLLERIAVVEAEGTHVYGSSAILSRIVASSSVEDILTSPVELIEEFKDASAKTRAFFRQKLRGSAEDGTEGVVA